MNRPRFYLRLRVTVSVVFGILCVLLIALWVRSFWHLDMYFIPVVNFVAQSLRGCFVLYWAQEIGVNFGGHQSEPASIAQLSHDIPGTYFWFRLTNLPTETTLLMPMWLPLAVTAGIATTPWLRWRFTLRTLLIASTLIAVVLCLIVLAVR